MASMAKGKKGKARLLSYQQPLPLGMQERARTARVVHRVKSEHQDIAVVEHGSGKSSDVRLVIDGELQFSSVDEYRYHECLVHPAIALASSLPARGASGLRVLLLGAGDGLAAREVLKHPAVEAIDIVDLDADVTDLCRAGTPRTIRRLVQLCENAFGSPKVTLHTTDALSFLTQRRLGSATADSGSRGDCSSWDVVIMDLPDPTTEPLAQLYTIEFFATALGGLRPEGGVLVTHGGDIFANGSAFWTIVRTLRAAVATAGAQHIEYGVATYPSTVPSFGVWGFALACTSRAALAHSETGHTEQGADADPPPPKTAFPLKSVMQSDEVAGHLANIPCRFLTERSLGGLFDLSPDVSEPVGIMDCPNATRVWMKCGWGCRGKEK